VTRDAPPPLPGTSRLPPGLVTGRQWLLRYRRPVAGLLAALAALVGLAALRAEPVGVDVVVVTADLPAGQVLVLGDLTVRRLPPATVPSQSLGNPVQALGRTLAGPVTAGEPLTSARLLTTAALPAGELALPVRPSDPQIASLLAPGSRADVLAAAGTAPARGLLLAGDVQVLDTEPDGSVVLALSAAQALAVSAAGSVALAAAGVASG
jgi:pilus assembly protein CpaB